MYLALKNLFLWGKIDINQLKLAVKKGLITKEEFKNISNKNIEEV